MKKTVICECVGNGHPDKVADQISDALLDAFLEKDPNTRAGIEVMVKDNIVVLGGEVKTTAQIDYEYVVRLAVSSVDYPANHHLDGNDMKVINLIGRQSPEISKSVDRADGVIGAGDQGFCVGFASNETKDYMPLGAYLARQLCKCADSIGHKYLGPDIKSQVVVTYGEDGKPHVDSILVSAMHQCSLEECRAIIREYIMDNGMGISDNLFRHHILGDSPEITLNPSGEWRIGGSISDCGMTNRKIVVDQCVDRTIRAKNHIPVSGIESTGIEIGHHIIAANKYMRIAVRIEYQIVSIGLSERHNRHLSLPSKHKFNVTGH